VNGWEKLPRRISKTQCYKNPNAMLIYVHCLLRANVYDDSYKGITLQAGQFLTSIRQLAKECGLTEKQTRTGIANLEKEDLIEVSPAAKGTKSGSIITIPSEGKEKILPNPLLSTFTADPLSVKGKEIGGKGKEKGKEKDSPNPLLSTFTADPLSEEGKEKGNSIRLNKTCIQGFKEGPALLRAIREIAAKFREAGFECDDCGSLEGAIGRAIKDGARLDQMSNAIDQMKAEVAKRPKTIRKPIAYFLTTLNSIMEVDYENGFCNCNDQEHG